MTNPISAFSCCSFYWLHWYRFRLLQKTVINAANSSLRYMTQLQIWSFFINPAASDFIIALTEISFEIDFRGSWIPFQDFNKSLRDHLCVTISWTTDSLMLFIVLLPFLPTHRGCRKEFVEFLQICKIMYRFITFYRELSRNTGNSAVITPFLVAVEKKFAFKNFPP